MAMHNLSRTTSESLVHHAITALDCLIVCAVASVAARRSPYLKLDGYIILSGMALASLVWWQRSSAWSFLIRVVVAAYFFRCTVFYVMGSDAVRAIAFGDAAVGLGALGVAYAARHIIFRYLPQYMGNGSRPCLRHGDRASTGGNDQVGQDAHRASNSNRTRTNAGLSSGGSLKTVSVVALCCAGVLGVAVTGGPATAGGVVVLSIFWLLAAGCIRLVKKADINAGDVEPEEAD